MKKLFFVLAAVAFTTFAQAQVKMPAPSPTQTLKQDFGLGFIEITYSRPLAKGRKIMGDLVPFGEVWRTGANAATKIRFSAPVEIMGKMIDSGTYALYTIPAAGNWQVILNKGITNWGSDGYTDKDDVARFTVKSAKTKTFIESFTMEIMDVKALTCNLEMKWENTEWSLPITAANLQASVRMQLEKAMAGADKKPYWQAAQFYNELDNNQSKALESIDMAVKENPKAYYMWLYKAKIEYAMGNKAAAKMSSKTSLDLAKAEKNMDYVKMNEDLMKKL